MFRTKHFTAASVIALALAGPAAADVTAAEVWEDWQQFMSSYGFSTTVGTATENGDTLTVTDFVMDMAVPDGRVTQKIDELTFKNQGDGTVMITMSPTYPVTISGTNPEGTPFNLTMTVTTDQMSMVASGDPQTTAYDIQAGRIAVSIDEIMEGGEAVPMDLLFAMNGIQGDYTMSGAADATAIQSTMTATDAVVTMNIIDGSDTVAMNATFQDIKSDGEGTAVNLFGNPNMAQALRDGAGTSGSFSHGAASYDMDVDVDGEQFVVTGKADSGDLNVSVTDQGLGYGGTSTGLDMMVSGSQIPFPQVNVTMAEYGFNLLMPVLKSDNPEDFQLAMTMGGFTISDEIWAIFDPFQKLPRDPATIAFDLAGKANWFFDLLDPEQAQAMEGSEVPGEIHALDINSLTVQAAGAMLTGSGGFTFDNTDMTTFDGMPAPTGSVDMKVVGANGLIDKLVEMGLLPDEQAMGARMMLGLFARPGDAPDELLSTIEVKGDGSIAANGQRLR